MATTIEVSGSGIRLLREARGRLTALESWPVPADGDPLAALAGAPLPSPLGRVTVLMHHPDLLLKTLLQPPAPPERLARLVRFELQGMAREDGEPVAVAWHVVKGMGEGDMRVLTLLAKRRLIDQVRRALAPHGGKLERLVHPAIGLYHAWKRQAGETSGDALLADIGGKHVHLALVSDGELIFLRSVQPGMDELARQVGELRGIPPADAARLLARMGKGAPADLHELIKRQAQAVAGLIGTNLRFARAQLHAERFEPKVVWLSGAGAQVHGFADALAERYGKPVRLINPFAGALSELPPEELDRQAALPSAWTPGLGGAIADQLELDALSEEREHRAAFWRGEGALRAGCAIALALLALAALRQGIANASAGATVGQLKGSGEAPGLVPRAEAAQAALDALRAERKQSADRLAFLDGERRAGRVALEALSAVAELQDPATCPIILREYRVKREGAATRVELRGFAQTAAKRGTADVQRAFERELARRYKPLAGLALKQASARSDQQEFLYVLTVPDILPTVSTAPYTGKQGKGLRIEARGIGALDPEGLARVLVDRLRSDESEATVAVTGDTATTTWTWSEKDGLARGR